MKVCLILMLTICNLAVLGQVNTSDPEARNKEVFQAYGYCYGQQKSVDRIRREFPQLRVALFRAETAFNATFGISCKAVKEQFGEALRLKLEVELDKYITDNPVSEGVAREFISEIEARANGDIETPVKETLLTFNPDLRANPALEFTRGYIRPYSTAGHAKAKGLSVAVRVPMSWISREGNRPNIVQFFKAEYGRSDVSMLIGIKDFTPPKGMRLTQRDIDTMFAPANLKDLVPEGGVMLEGKPIILEGQKGAMLVYDVTVERLDLKITMRTLSYSVLYKNRLISIEFSVGGLMEDRAESVAQFVKNRPLFVMIANSMNIGDIYSGN